MKRPEGSNLIARVAAWALLLWGLIDEDPWKFAVGALIIILNALDER